MSDSPLPAFRPVPRTGVIFVTSEAARLGFGTDREDWCNLGQGQPEAGELPGAPPRVQDVPIRPDDHEYAPVQGLWEVRQAVAELYNALYRTGRGSKYTAENVAICGGGRLALTRTAAALGHVNLGHFLPDYTAYEELLDIFRSFTPIPLMLDGADGYQFSRDTLQNRVMGMGLGAILLSNPCNPTGKLIAGEELEAWVDVGRQLDCALLFDEFYSNYIWADPAQAGTDSRAPTVSAAAHVEDVNRDPVIIFNGLTKNWRYPGWRVSWVVGPKQVIDAVSSAGSFLDGGGSRPLQRAALPVLSKDYVVQETVALQETFAPKRRVLIDGLRALGVEVELEPEGTFYVWGKLAGLPEHLADGMHLFRAALEKKVIVVPGEFFDVNPGQRQPAAVRRRRTGRFFQYARFSFGPTMSTVQEGLRRLGAIVNG